MKVLIGSRQRLDFPTKKIFPDFVLFVEKEEFDIYKKKYPANEIVCLKESNKGFGYLMNSMVDYTLERGDRYFFSCDDDILGLKKRTTGIKLISIDKPEDIDLFFKEGDIFISAMDLAQLGVSFQGQNWYWGDPLKLNTAVWGMAFLDAKAIKAVGGYITEVPLFTDYEITARLIKNGYKVGVWYDYAFDHKMKGIKGGNESFYKNQDIVNHSINYVSQRYPECTKIIFHENHGINEIRFLWNKIKCQTKSMTGYN
jgi:hypothetical protein